MNELSDSTFRNSYIIRKCEEILGIRVDSSTIEFVERGVMNFVYRVRTAKGTIYFKQALKQAKCHQQIGSDLASVPPSRIRFERKVIDKICDRLPKETEVPHVLSYDCENNILVLTDVASDGVLLENALLNGDFNAESAVNVGKFIGTCHRSTYNKGNVIRDSREQDRMHWSLMLDMRTKAIKAGRISIRVDKELTSLFDDVIENHSYDILVNLDYCPKNIFQRKDGSIGVIDFELASGTGDPAYDIGFLIGHYFIFSTLCGVPPTSLQAIKLIMKSYLDAVGTIRFGGLLGRIMKYAGAVLLYRILGSSPASYIPKERYRELLPKACVLVTGEFNNISEVAEVLKESQL